MGGERLKLCNAKENGYLPNAKKGISFHQSHPIGGLFASIGQMGNNSVSFGGDPNSKGGSDGNGVGGGSSNNGFKLPYMDLYVKYVSSPGEGEVEGFKIVSLPEDVDESNESDDVVVENGKVVKKKKGGGGWGLKLKVKVGNPSLRRLISGAIAGAVSRTAVAPLETIRTHLMVGSSGGSSGEVFQDIMKHDGWTGLFRGNLVNVIRVAPSKAVELFVYDTVNKNLSPKLGEKAKIPIAPSFIAGACAGVSSTVLTYPLELVKTRLTIQRGAYKGIIDAFVKIIREEGFAELYRGLAPSVIGVIPYAATNYFAYDTLRKGYRKMFKTEKIGNIETLLIGSLAGAFSSSATFPLEVARKHMQAGVNYNNIFHALACILEKEGIQGLYRGLGPSCVKLVPAAGISFMCYEACKRILVEDQEEA